MYIICKSPKNGAEKFEMPRHEKLAHMYVAAAHPFVTSYYILS